MEDICIEFKNVSKRYFIGEHSVRTLREDAERLFGRILGKSREDKKEIWALKDVNFKVRAGESVGIIGQNGSGKTTLFKLISRITFSTKGKVYVNGRIGSLIDLNAGFHPELTGLENIYLNAAIRGMKRKAISMHVDEILAFAEIERFKDTPVKHYSAGMRVRLGFSVAVHCPFDILLVDEVLAVGDISFQRKCFQKIATLKNIGKTILFVSQDTEKIKQVCLRALYLSYGSIIIDSNAQETTYRYLGSITNNERF